MTNPKIVCLCGSTRFMDDFIEANFQETLAGHIVLSVGVDMRSSHPVLEAIDHANQLDVVKAKLDALHLRKIDLADEVLVINPGGYIGESTRREIAYAVSKGKVLRCWDNTHIADFKALLLKLSAFDIPESDEGARVAVSFDGTLVEIKESFDSAAATIQQPIRRRDPNSKTDD